MAKTLKEKFIKALQARGSVITESKSGKYVTMTRPRWEGEFYFLGNSGSLRIGRCSAKSIPVSNAFKTLLLSD
jgi:hypothetical protein